MSVLSLSLKRALSSGWCLSDTGGALWVPRVSELVGGGDCQLSGDCPYPRVQRF